LAARLPATSRYGAGWSSSIGEDTGELSLRVAPEDLPRLFSALGGSVKQHTTQSEDKIGTVIDVEAKLKNLTGFRDSLRAMLPRASAVKDAVEIQRELTDVQSELDALATRRKVLANETEKVAVEIAFRPREAAGALSPLAATFMDSLAALITTLVAAVPWLIVVAPAAWFGLRVLRRRRAS
jgi:hypothetical protein